MQTEEKKTVNFIQATPEKSDEIRKEIDVVLKKHKAMIHPVTNVTPEGTLAGSNLILVQVEEKEESILDTKE